MTPQAARLAAEHLDVAVRLARAAWPDDPDEAESVAMLALCEAAMTFRYRGRFAGWLGKIIGRRLVDELRASRKRIDSRHTLAPRPASLDVLRDGGWVRSSPDHADMVATVVDLSRVRLTSTEREAVAVRMAGFRTQGPPSKVLSQARRKLEAA